MFDFEFDFDFAIDLEHFQADTQALAPSAMPASKKGFNIKRILLNLAVISFLIGFIYLYTALFGAKNAVSAISIATAMLMFLNVDMGIKTSHAPILIITMFLFTGISSHFGTWNPFLGIAVNFISIFLIVTFSCQAITSRVYLPFVVCYIFSQGTPVYEMDLVKRMIGLLAGGILVSIVYVISHRKTKHHRGILSLFKEIHPTSLRTRFALRLAFSLTLGMFLGDIFGLRRTAWICMTINSLVLPFLHETRKRFPFRLLAQLPAAAIVYLFFVLIMPKEWYVVGLFFTSFLYMFATNYFIQQIFVATNALVGAMTFTDAPDAILMRFVLVSLGAAIVVVTNVIAIWINPITIMKKIWERIRISRAVHKRCNFPEHQPGTGHHKNHHYHHKKQQT